MKIPENSKKMQPAKRSNKFKNLLLDKAALKSNIKYMVIFGLLAAVFANIKFTIPGLESGTSDAREILALISTAFLTHWIYAFGVGLIASFGAYHNLLVNILMHVTAISLAWFILQYIKSKTSNITLISIMWCFNIIILSLFVYPGVYTISNYFLGNIEFDNIINAHILFVKGTTFEIAINVIITSLVVFSILIFKEVEKKSTYLQLIEDNTELGLWDWDLQKDKKIYNKQWAKILGYTLEEVYKEEDIWKDLIHKDDFKTTLKKLEDNLQGKTKFYYAEYRMKSKSGDYIWIHDKGRVLIRDDKGNALRMVGIHLDITKRKQMSEKIQNLQTYLANMINSMPSMIIGVNPEYKITQWNKKIAEVSGISEEEAIGKLLPGVLPHMKKELDKIEESIKTQKITASLKQKRLYDNEIQFEDVTIYPLTTDGVKGAVIRIDNITSRVQMEEMMIQSEKMLSVGGLAAGMAHEINNPLAGMMQTASVMKDRLTNLELAANLRAAEEAGTSMDNIKSFMNARGIIKMLKRISESGSRAAEIVSNMLSFARKSDTSFSTQNLAELFDQTVDLAGSDYDLKKKFDFRQIKVIREYEDNLPDVLCESGKIQQVLLNILRNGAEAMQDDETSTEPCFTFRLAHEKNKDAVRIEIEDNGPGMDGKTRKRIFEPFFTTKPENRGTGLGLSVSYFIITENHGGEMSVQSSPGKGTKFIIKLPLNRTEDRGNKGIENEISF